MQDEFKNLKVAKVGDRQPAKIVQVDFGKAEEYRNDAYFEGLDNEEEARNAPSVRVTAENGAELVMAMPLGEYVSPKSKLGMYFRTYGGFPEVGQQVTTKVSESGYLEIVLEI